MDVSRAGAAIEPDGGPGHPRAARGLADPWLPAGATGGGAP